MKVTAKCHNYSGCVLAYRQETIQLDSGAPLVCPECGKTVVLWEPGQSWIRTTMILSGTILVIGAIAAYFMFTSGKKPHDPGKSPVVLAPAVKNKSDTDPSRITEMTNPAEPPRVITAPPTIELDLTKEENRSVKSEVLVRIDLMPNVTKANKDKLYVSVERARRLGKVLTIPFASGQTTLSTADIQLLKSSLEAPEIMQIRDDPTAVFVVLGYADSKGDDKTNLAVSQFRADQVLSVMRSKVGIQNVMHAVAMGSSKLLDAENREKNRVVEIWAVLP